MWTNPSFWLTWLGIAVFMEFWAMFLHGQLWHGVLWFSHRSHHEPKTSYLEFNDIFAAFHASLAIFLIVYGFEAGPGFWYEISIAAGFGMTTFGMAYFLVHDGFIHERLPVHFLAKIAYLRRVRNSHRVHHLRDHQGPYGLFLGEWELRRAHKQRRQTQAQRSRQSRA